MRAAESRAGGVLLHPTSLPSPYGIGDLGPGANRWIAWLARAGCRLWQMLPLGPTGFGDSPYQSFSAFAGNPLLISPDLLIDDGLLHPDDLAGLPAFPDRQVAYGGVIAAKGRLLRLAGGRFREGAAGGIREGYEAFCRAEAGWLEDYALFMALKADQSGHPWVGWPADLANREADALAQARRALSDPIEDQRLWQYLFERQWGALRGESHEEGLLLIGDVPIYVSHDSADVWANRELFHLDERGIPTVVAGVPPDYFSATGQLWGNPLFRWDVMAANGYAWWIERLRAVLARVDVVRLDHFRGFEAYWEIPAGSPTAETGRWVPGPGAGLFQALAEALGDLPLIAEDLGVITPEVEALRDRFDLPGMKVLQFAFNGDPESPFLPHNFTSRCVVYTGTHDNDTTCGWHETAGEEVRDFYRRYLGRDGGDVAWDLIRAAWGSVANWSLAPLQDFLALGSEARMNYPGRPGGNWTWRALDSELDEALAARIRAFNTIYGRAVSKESGDQI